SSSTSNGNYVFEPGETVMVAPSWRAPLDHDVYLTGTVTQFSGPTSALYSVTDGTATYGAIPAGGGTSCLATGDCYELSVTSPFQRPAHWDATLTESVGEALGVPQIKTWTLHIGKSFDDVPPSDPLYYWVETTLHNGVMGGCGPGMSLFCPSQRLTREEMAIDLLVAKEGPGYAPTACVEGAERFTDVPHDSPFCPWVEELARRNIDTGCSPTAFCPTTEVRRADLMRLIELTQHGPGFAPTGCIPGAELFKDMPATDPDCPYVEELSRELAGYSFGGGDGGDPTCDPSLSRPTEFAQRRAASRFLGAALGLTLLRQ